MRSVTVSIRIPYIFGDLWIWDTWECDVSRGYDVWGGHHFLGSRSHEVPTLEETKRRIIIWKIDSAGLVISYYPTSNSTSRTDKLGIMYSPACLAPLHTHTHSHTHAKRWRREIIAMCLCLRAPFITCCFHFFFNLFRYVLLLLQFPLLHAHGKVASVCRRSKNRYWIAHTHTHTLTRQGNKRCIQRWHCLWCLIDIMFQFNLRPLPN